MPGYYPRKKNRRVPRRVWYLVASLLILAIAGMFFAHHLYNQGLKPVSDNQKSQIFTVEKGSTVKEIGASLQTEKLIRSAWAFQLYIHNKNLGDKLQAGTYAISPSESTPQIVSTLTKGKVATRLVTILPGRRIDQVRADLINDGFAPAAVDRALDPARYSDVPVLSFKPASVNSLEGLLWPDSYQKDDNTDPEVIVRESLTTMGEHLTPDIQAAFAAQGLTTYQGVTLASIIIKEVNKPVEQGQAAQVFLSRIKQDMPLGSDVTAIYGSIQADRGPSVTYDSPYNTHIHKGLPPSPISTIGPNALNAAAHPAGTDWLYFVTGDDGTTYFSRTLQEHEALTDKYCHELCGR